MYRKLPSEIHLRHLVKVMQSYLLSEHVCRIWPVLLALLVASTATVKILIHWHMLLCLSASVPWPRLKFSADTLRSWLWTQVISLVWDLPAKCMICQRATRPMKGRVCWSVCRDYWRSLWCHTPCQGISCKCLKLGEVNPYIFLHDFRFKSFSWTLNLLKGTGTQVQIDSKVRSRIRRFYSSF